MATIADIARQAGVSVQTVSNVLNGRNKGVRTTANERARRIRAIAQKLNYRPNASARAMVQGQTKCIGLLLDPSLLRSAITPQLVSSLVSNFAGRGYRLVINHIPEAAENDAKSLPGILNEWAVDAFAVNYHLDIPEHIVNAIERHEHPWVSINNKHPNAIYPDEYRAAKTLAQALVDRGCRRLAYVDFSYYHFLAPKRHYSRTDRLAGYKAVLRKAGREPYLVTDREGRPDVPLGKVLADLLQKRNGPDAFVFCHRGDLRALRDAEAILGRAPLPAACFMDYSGEPQPHTIVACAPWSTVAARVAAFLCGGKEVLGPVPFEFLDDLDAIE